MLCVLSCRGDVFPEDDVDAYSWMLESDVHL